MILRRFNDKGVDAFREYLGALRANDTLPAPDALVSDPTLSTPLTPEMRIVRRPFENRMDFARWLTEIFDEADAKAPLADTGFWTWLTAALFDQVCPPDEKGRRKVGAISRYIPESHQWRRRYRHLLANPFQIFQLHIESPASALVVLANPLDRPGELTEQIAARLDLVSCSGTLALATHLFIDSKTGKPKYGASGKAARRFGKLMNQYTRTWDLQTITTVQFADLLPKQITELRGKRRRK